MSRRKKYVVIDPDPGQPEAYVVRVYCDHGEKQPRIGIARHVGGTWAIFGAEHSVEWATYRLACRKCGHRLAVGEGKLHGFLDVLRSNGVHSVSLQGMLALLHAHRKSEVVRGSR